MTHLRYLFVLIVALAGLGAQEVELAPLSDESQMCVDCHGQVTPGVVAAWRDSRHARTTPTAALAQPALQRRFSADETPAQGAESAVGCFECHGQHPDDHADAFNHFGYTISTVVSPNDCATCHTDEVEQYADTKKANAHGTLAHNPLFSQFVSTSTAHRAVVTGALTGEAGTENARNEGCYSCHGTRITVEGLRTVDSMLGEIEVPNLQNWPNSGVGRINPDGSQGACTACHTRHTFSIAVARQPETCGHCHLKPDVPAYEVYKESRHGNLYRARGRDWNWDQVPWRLGEDTEAPTCATCHNSLLTAGEVDPEVVAPRTHNFGERLWVRIFGLPYSHPQPVHGRTWELRNAAGQPLPTDLDGTPAATGLISAAEQADRQVAMSRVCTGCHSSSTPIGHFARFNETVRETDLMVRAATDLMNLAWNTGQANPANLFDEEIEGKWVDQWLIYANSARLGSAMMGPDYVGFEQGWHYMNRNLQSMGEWLAGRGLLGFPLVPVPAEPHVAP